MSKVVVYKLDENGVVVWQYPAVILDRQAAVVREISKIYESVCRGTLQELREQIDRGELKEKGEIVIIVSGKPK